MLIYYFDNCLTIWFVPVAVNPDAPPIIIATTMFGAGIIDGIKK